MRFFGWFLLLPLLSACAPRTADGAALGQTSAAPASAGAAAPTFRAAFSRYGVAWVSDGQACVARAPSYQATCPKLGRVVDTAWNDGDAWAAVPSLGLIVTLDRAARTVPVGAVVALSANNIYREDGSALSYGGSPSGRVAGAPSLAITGGNGQDYVRLAGQVVRVADGAVTETGTLIPVGGELVATPTGAQSSSVPTAISEDGANVYRLQGDMLERVDLAGKVLRRVPHAAGKVGLVAGQVVTVTQEGTIRRFTWDLQEIR